MELENFKSLVELQSLLRESNSCQSKISEERSRIVQLQAKTDSVKSDLDGLRKGESVCRSELANLERELHMITTSLSRSKEHYKNAQTVQQSTALEQEMKSGEIKKWKLEERVFLQMESLEELGENICEHEQFLKNIPTTCSEITAEVGTTVSKEQEQIVVLSERQNNLLELLPPNFKKLYLETAKRYGEKSLAAIRNHCCTSCSCMIPRNMEQMIEGSYKIESCPSCGRILIPSAAYKQ